MRIKKNKIHHSQPSAARKTRTKVIPKSLDCLQHVSSAALLAAPTSALGTLRAMLLRGKASCRSSLQQVQEWLRAWQHWLLWEERALLTMHFS